MRLKVVRPLLWGGVRREIGEFLEIEDGKAIEAIATGRVARAAEETPPRPGPMTTQTAPVLAAVAPEPGKKRKGAKEESNVAS